MTAGLNTPIAGHLRSYSVANVPAAATVGFRSLYAFWVGGAYTSTDAPAEPQRHATDDDKARKAAFDWYLRHEEEDAGRSPVTARQATVEQVAETDRNKSFEAAINAISGLDINSLSALQIEQIGNAVDQTIPAAPVEVTAAHIKRRRLIAALLFSRMIH